MNLTLEERERLAYITNSPDHPLIVLAMGGDEEMQQEIEDLKAEADRLDTLLSEANEAAEKAETEAEALREQIEAAGLDLV